MTTSVQLARLGRYKYTGVYDDSDGAGPRFGPLMAPGELDGAGAYKYQTHIVSSADMDFLDRVAVRYYGAGKEMMWWALCRINGIVDVSTDVYPGMRLRIPPMEAVRAYEEA
jgi:hypothetical protein